MADDGLDLEKLPPEFQQKFLSEMLGLYLLRGTVTKKDQDEYDEACKEYAAALYDVLWQATIKRN